jgi:hypothetical protein
MKTRGWKMEDASVWSAVACQLCLAFALATAQATT